MGNRASSSYTAQYSDKALDSNASTPAALGAGYQGLSSDVDGDGVADFTRYWNVFRVNMGAGGAENGKLVQIIVRWKEPGFGYRQVTTSTFKHNPAYIFQ
jgi:hypothetical protein